MAKAIARRNGTSIQGDIEKRLRALERDGASPKQVMQALAKAGITDLEELVSRVLARQKSKPEPIDLSASTEHEVTERKAAPRKPPKIAFTVGDVTYDPRDIKRFDNQPLCMVPRTSARGEPELVAFAGSGWLRTLRDYFRLVQVGVQTGGINAAPARVQTHLHPLTGYGAGAGYDPNHPHSGSGSAWRPSVNPGTEVLSLICRFYVDPAFDGDQFWLGANSQVADLRKFSRGILGLGDWNDVISSLQTEGATCVLYTDINFQDHDSLIVMPTEIYAHLGLYGWDDRVSSIQNFGQIY
jgi:hypothetical protein